MKELKMKINIINSLLMYIVWSTILLCLGVIGMFYDFMLSYTICCVGIAIIFSLDLFSIDRPLYRIIILLLIIILLAPILMYAIWLFAIYHLISELEKNV
jgi:hypothetical protein